MREKFFFIFVISLAGIAAQYNFISGIEIPDQNIESDLSKNPFIKPNELNPHVYAEVLKDREGLLISVGTYRALIAFSLGNFSHLIMLDIDKRILDYNRNLLDQIKKIAEDFPKDVAKQRQEYNKQKHYQNLFELSNTPYFWQDDEKWAKITRALGENRIFVVHGDLTNSIHNQALLQALNDESIKNIPRVLDISNVPVYVRENQKVASVLEQFSSSNPEKDLVLTTSSFPLSSKNPDIMDPISLKNYKPFEAIEWYYYWSNLKDYVEFLRQDSQIE